METYRTDAGHARRGVEAAGPGGGEGRPVIRFPWNDRTPPLYRVWAVAESGPAVGLLCLDAVPERAEAVRRAVRHRARLAGEPVAVVVSAPNGDRVSTIGEG